MRQSTPLPRFIVQRLLQAIPMVIGVVVINFLLIHLAPGDPVSALVGDFPAPPEYIQQVKTRYGLDKPIPVQLFNYLKNVARGDLGYSFAKRDAVSHVVGTRMGNTLVLTVTALLFSTIAGMILGVIAARRPYSIADNIITTVGLLGYSIPVFWLGQIMILVFAVKLGWLPAQGMRDQRLFGASGFASFTDLLKHLVLPAMALSFQFLAVSTRITRASMLEVMDKEYITTARAKGLSDTTVRVRHALRNALIPVVTVFGFQAGFVFAGSALIETVFAWPGIGRLLFESVLLRDYPVLLGILLLVAVTVLIMNLLTDIAYGYLDPRIRI